MSISRVCAQHLRGKGVASVPSQTYSVACLACAGRGPPAWPGTSTDSTCSYGMKPVVCTWIRPNTPAHVVTAKRLGSAGDSPTRLGWWQHPYGRCYMTGHSCSTTCPEELSPASCM